MFIHKNGGEFCYRGKPCFSFTHIDGGGGGGVLLPGFLRPAASSASRRGVIEGSLSTRVFETRTATGSKLFSLLTYPHTTTFTLLSIVSPSGMSGIKICLTIGS